MMLCLDEHGGSCTSQLMHATQAAQRVPVQQDREQISSAGTDEQLNA